MFNTQVGTNLCTCPSKPKNLNHDGSANSSNLQPNLREYRNYQTEDMYKKTFLLVSRSDLGVSGWTIWGSRMLLPKFYFTYLQIFGHLGYRVVPSVGPRAFAWAISATFFKSKYFCIAFTYSKTERTAGLPIT